MVTAVTTLPGHTHRGAVHSAHKWGRINAPRALTLILMCGLVAALVLAALMASCTRPLHPDRVTYYLGSKEDPTTAMPSVPKTSPVEGSTESKTSSLASLPLDALDVTALLKEDPTTAMQSVPATPPAESATTETSSLAPPPSDTLDATAPLKEDQTLARAMQSAPATPPAESTVSETSSLALTASDASGVAAPHKAVPSADLTIPSLMPTKRWTTRVPPGGKQYQIVVTGLAKTPLVVLPKQGSDKSEWATTKEKVTKQSKEYAKYGLRSLQVAPFVVKVEDPSETIDAYTFSVPPEPKTLYPGATISAPPEPKILYPDATMISTWDKDCQLLQPEQRLDFTKWAHMLNPLIADIVNIHSHDLPLPTHPAIAITSKGDGQCQINYIEHSAAYPYAPYSPSPPNKEWFEAIVKRIVHLEFSVGGPSKAKTIQVKQETQELQVTAVASATAGKPPSKRKLQVTAVASATAGKIQAERKREQDIQQLIESLATYCTEQFKTKLALKSALAEKFKTELALAKKATPPLSSSASSGSLPVA